MPRRTKRRNKALGYHPDTHAELTFMEVLKVQDHADLAAVELEAGRCSQSGRAIDAGYRAQGRAEAHMVSAGERPAAFDLAVANLNQVDVAFEDKCVREKPKSEGLLARMGLGGLGGEIVHGRSPLEVALDNAAIYDREALYWRRYARRSYGRDPHPDSELGRTIREYERRRDSAFALALSLDKL